MLSAAKHLLFSLKTNKKQILRADYSEVFKWRSALRSAQDDMVGAFFSSLHRCQPSLILFERFAIFKV
jgi:hypothetical protein